MIKWIRVSRVIFYMLWNLPYVIILEKINPRAIDQYLHNAAQKWSAMLLWACEIDLKIKNPENFPRGDQRPVVIMANHQSQVDIPALFFATGCILGFVAKKELSKFPVLRHWMEKIGCVFIDRKNRTRAKRSIEEGATKLGNNPMVLFPEGTRSKTGELLPMKIGGVRLAILAKAWVVPVRIQGTRKGWEERGKNKGKVQAELVFMPPFQASQFTDDKRSLLQIREKIFQAWQDALPQTSHNLTDS